MAIKYGNKSNEILNGSLRNDFLAGLGGNDTINGGAGVDTAWYSGDSAGYRFGMLQNQLFIQDVLDANGQDGTDVVNDIEKLQFQTTKFTLNDGRNAFGLTTDHESNPQVAALKAGGYVVVWASKQDSQDDSHDVLMQRFDAYGQPIADAIKVNIIQTDNQDHPSVAVLENGDIVIAWQSIGQDGSGAGIYYTRFDAEGHKIVPDTLVNAEVTLGDQYRPTVAAASDGGFSITWDTPDSSGQGIANKQYDAAGTPFASIPQVNMDGQLNQIEAVSIGLINSAAHSYALLWRDTSDGSIKGTVTYDGSRIPDLVIEPSNLFGYQGELSAAALKNGGVVASYVIASNEFIQNASVYLSFLNGVLDTTTPSIKIDHAYQPSVTVLNDGNVVVAYTSTYGEIGIKFQRYDSHGHALGDETLVHAQDLSFQNYNTLYNTSIAALADGGFVIVYDEQTSHGRLYSQQYNASGQLVSTLLTGDTDNNNINLANGATPMVNGGDGNDTINGQSGDDTLLGGAGNDALNGNVGNDILNGGLGADKLVGGKGDDSYVLDNIGDIITEVAGGGNDTVTSFLNAYTLNANIENLIVNSFLGAGIGNNAGNHIVGATGGNLLDGKAGADFIDGGAGNDIIIGGLGNDILAGGEDADTFVFNTVLSSTQNVDELVDFNAQVDTITLSRAIFTQIGAGTTLAANAFELDVSAATQSTTRIFFEQGSGSLYYDKDGSGTAAAVKFAVLDTNNVHFIDQSIFKIVA